jgi:hypothetical protein
MGLRPRSRGFDFVACSLLLLSAGCGGSDDLGGGVNSEVPTQHQLATRVVSATVGGCTDSRVRDNGTVVYVTVPVDSLPEMPLSVSVHIADGNHATERTLEIPDFNAVASMELSPQAERRLSVHRRGFWRSIVNEGAWRWRDGAGLLAKDGSLYLMGGWSGGTEMNNDVWSTTDLMSWTELIPRAPWQGRHGAGWATHNGRLWVIGGDLLTDVWSSVDGASWRQETSFAGFGARYTPIAASLGNRLLVYAGMAWGPTAWCAFRPECFAFGFNDVWSTDDGAAWVQIQRQAPWAGRGLIHGAMVFQGRAYIVAGGLKLASAGAALAETTVEHRDVWSSSDGIEWRLEAVDAGFPARTHLAVLGTDKGCYVAGGSVGTQQATTNEVFFAPDCVHFRHVAGYQQIGVRHAASLAEFNGTIVLLGGHADTAGTLVWQYFPDD